MRHDFTVHLFSNLIEERDVISDDLRDLAPESNPLSYFRTELGKEVSLDEDYEVAITEISFTHSWYNLQRQAQILIENKASGRQLEAWVPAGKYTKIALANIVNEKLQRVAIEGSDMRIPQLAYNSITHTFHIGGRRHFKVEFDDILKDLLGSGICEPEGALFEPSAAKRHKRESRSAIKAQGAHHDYGKHGDITYGIASILVYCDVIKHGYVGNKIVPLLKAVHIEPDREFGFQQYSAFLSPEYKPLLARNFDGIHVSLYDDSGALIPFRFGRVRLTLNFRPSRNGFA